MEDLEIVKFNPTREFLVEIAEQYKWLKIKDTEDKEWFEMVKTARKDLQQKRLDIAKFGKAMREKAFKFQKDVIAEEKSLIAIIEPVEIFLQDEEMRIKQEIEVEKRKNILPDRKTELERHSIIADDDKILAMTSDEFNKFVQDKREEKIQEAEKKIAEEKKALEEIQLKKIREEELEKARKEWEEKAKIETEARLKKEQEEKEAREKQVIIDEQNKKKAEQEKLEKQKKYQKWLEDNNYNEDDYFIANHLDRKVMYKKVSEFLIK